MSEARSLGRYVIVDEVGRGAMGVVYRALHPAFGIPVAIKVLVDDRAHDGKLRQRLQREASVMASVDHPGIARVYDFDADGDSLFIVMELIEGESLRALLLREHRLPEAAAVQLLVSVLEAVGAAHARGIVHRDLKPDNVMITPEGQVKVVDFGLSKMTGDASRVTAAGVALGTPHYMAPEQLRGGALDGRTDIYALGVMLYELLAGHTPFVGGTFDVIRAQIEDPPPPDPAIRPELMNVVATAMAKDPRQRFQTYVEFALALSAATQPAAAHVPVSAAEPKASAPRPSRRPRRHRRLPGAAVLTTTAATMLIAVLAVTAVTFSDPGNPSAPVLATVQAYLQGLAAGDAAQLWNVVTVDDAALPPGAPRALGRDQLAAMLQLAANRPPAPSAITLASVRPDASGVEVVEVRVLVGGTPRQLVLRLAQLAGGWRVELTPGAIRLPALPPGRVLLDGLPVTAGGGSRVAVLPGAHHVEFDPQPPFLATTAEVAADQPYPAGAPVALAVQLPEAVLGQARDAVRAAFNACAGSTAAAPAGCPQSAAGAAEPVRWTSLRDPGAGITVGFDGAGSPEAAGDFAMVAAYAVHLPDDVRHVPSAGRFLAPLRYTGSGWVLPAGVARDGAPSTAPPADPDQLRSAVAAGFRACASSRLLRPADCPESVASSLFVSGVAWTLGGDPLAGATTAFDAARAVLTVSGRFDLACAYVEGGQAKRADSSGTYRADLLWDGTRGVLVTITAA